MRPFEFVASWSYENLLAIATGRHAKHGGFWRAAQVRQSLSDAEQGCVQASALLERESRAASLSKPLGHLLAIFLAKIESLQ